MARQGMVTRYASSMNGISVAYLMGFTNAVMVAVNAFGVNMNDTQRVAVAGLVNASLILGIHLAHRIGETNPTTQADTQEQDPVEAPATGTAPAG